MKIYREMNVGTATPPADVLARIPHWCVNIVAPSEAFSVARYLEYAEAALATIEDRGERHILSGGTPLYHKALAEGLFPGPGADPQVRDKLTAIAREQGPRVLHERLAQVDPQSARRIHPHDLKRVVRALEVVERTGRPMSAHQTQFGRPRTDRAVAMVGLLWDRQELAERINERVERMLAQGLVEEAHSLYEREPPLSAQARAAVGYAELFAHFAGRLSRDEAVDRIKRNTRRLAKSQMTWLRKFDCQWIPMSGERDAGELASEVLASWEQRLEAAL